MQVIATIKHRQHALGMFWIASDLIEIHYCVEMAGSTNPFVDGLPVSLAGRTRVIEARSAKRQNGYADGMPVQKSNLWGASPLIPIIRSGS
jgi:hypothetical protein